jgi:hypothetical protein
LGCVAGAALSVASARETPTSEIAKAKPAAVFIVLSVQPTIRSRREADGMDEAREKAVE